MEFILFFSDELFLLYKVCHIKMIKNYAIIVKLFPPNQSTLCNNAEHVSHFIPAPNGFPERMVNK